VFERDRARRSPVACLPDQPDAREVSRSETGRNLAARVRQIRERAGKSPRSIASCQESGSAPVSSPSWVKSTALLCLCSCRQEMLAGCLWIACMEIRNVPHSLSHWALRYQLPNGMPKRRVHVLSSEGTQRIQRMGPSCFPPSLRSLRSLAAETKMPNEYQASRPRSHQPLNQVPGAGYCQRRSSFL